MTSWLMVVLWRFDRYRRKQGASIEGIGIVIEKGFSAVAKPADKAIR